jgi:ureidoacrylate peracid hydrolase
MNTIELAPELLERWRGATADGIDPRRTALVVIDLQRAFIEKGYPAYGQHVIDILPNVNRLTKAFRDVGAHIVFTRHSVADDGSRAPLDWQLKDDFFRLLLDSLRYHTPGHDLHPEVEVAPTDQIIDKYRYSAFLPISSTLDADLRARGIDTVVITGTVTNVCCESSARDAHMLNYDVVFVADATAAMDDQSHNATLATMALIFADVKTTDQVIANLRPGTKS